MQQAERAIFDLRRGQPVRVKDDNGDVVAVAVENLTTDTLAWMRTFCGGHPGLIITPNRTRALGLEPGNAPAVRLPLRDDVAVKDVFALATAVSDDHPHHVHPSLAPATRPEHAALHLTRAGKLIPAAVSVSAKDVAATERLDRLEADGTLLRVAPGDALAVTATPALEMVSVSDAYVPLEDAANTRFMLFREANGLLEHVAVLIGNEPDWPEPLPVRLHSSCLTGDLFGSLRCDCGEQLRNSVRAIEDEGGGVLLYLAQEGRGIGLANKLRAYTLQDQGLDTVDADCSLGFSADERRYEAAVEMLHQLEVRRVSLFTNNPLKIEALEDGGITVGDRRPLLGSVNAHNARYLNTKAEKAGHWLDELLSRTLPERR